MRPAIAHLGRPEPRRGVDEQLEPITLEVPALDFSKHLGLGLAVGFRQLFFEIMEGKEAIGEATAGAGCGNDFIVVRWREHRGVITARDLLLAFVRSTGDCEAIAEVEAMIGDDPCDT